MTKYILTKKAVADLTSIWNYTFDKWSEQQANKYYKMLLSICQEIADNPNLGRDYNEIKEELFGIKANRHITFYRKFENKSIEITRILHERMDLKLRMTE
ncbi:MAG: type II toxin-antitoxin system RelE/ParE family toxin [Saprospiraceae bacterium]